MTAPHASAHRLSSSPSPAFAPGTGAPEVGGFTSHRLLQLVRGLRGFDVLAVSPPYDHGDITANLAFEFLALIADKRKQG